MFGLRKKYSVDYGGCEFFYKNAKKKYKAGEKVTVYYDLIATDTSYTFYLDGEELNVGYSDKNGFEISFVMPAKDVKLTVTMRNTMICED